MTVTAHFLRLLTFVCVSYIIELMILKRSMGMKKLRHSLLFTVIILTLALFSCDSINSDEKNLSIEITNGTKITLEVGESVQLNVKLSEGESLTDVGWYCGSSCVEVSNSGLVTALYEGNATVRAQLGDKFDLIAISVSSKSGEYQTEEEIVNALYSLKAGEYLGGGEAYTLSGTVHQIDKKSGNYITLHFTVCKKSVMCYKLVGDGIDTVDIGSTITVRGQLTNYKNKYFEFAEGCVLIKHDGENSGVSDDNPYKNVDKEEFYANYKPADSLADALYRSECGLLSGTNEVPGQYVKESSYMPMDGLLYIRNTTAFYIDDGKGYIVLDAYGREVIRIYEGGAYITTEEVAAYVYAFGGSNGSIPANYTADKNASPIYSIWGEYLRCNHSYFSGDTDKYPHEPELPNILGCGGALSYYEMDIGTTGTVTTPEYPATLYNDGYKITRGAARIVYGREDLNENGIYEIGEVYVFYTANHYSDFREYLNYYGGWGAIFGSETGAALGTGKTPYAETSYNDFGAVAAVVFMPALLPESDKYLNFAA